MIHSYVLFSFVVTILSILVISEKLQYAFFVFLCAVPLILFRFLFHTKNKRSTAVLFICVGFLLCMYIQSKIYNDLEEYNRGFVYQDKETVEIIGSIDSYPSYRFSNNQYIVSVIKPAYQTDDSWNKLETTLLPIKILVYTQPYQKFMYLDRISFTSKLSDVREEDLMWQNQYKKIGVQYVVWYPSISNVPKENLDSFRQKILYKIFVLKIYIRSKAIELFSSHTSSLVLGMLLGGKDELSKEEKDMFNKANLSHILVVSGYNISLVITFVFLFLKNFHRFIRVAFALIFVFLFVLLVGFDASVVRSALMGGLIIVSKIIHKQSSGVHTLILVATIMILHNPNILFDIGFHLSFLATYSLFILPSFKRIPEYIMTTLWVFGFISIYTLYLSDSFSFVGILTNILILVLVPVFMFISFISLIFSFIHMYVGIDILILESISRYIFFVAYLAQFAPRFEYNISPQIIVGIYVFVLSLITFIQNRYTTLEFIEKHYQKFVPQKPS